MHFCPFGLRRIARPRGVKCIQMIFQGHNTAKYLEIHHKPNGLATEMHTIEPDRM